MRTARSVGLGFAALVLALTLALTLAPPSVEAASSSTLKQQLKDLSAQLRDVRSNLQKAEAARKSALGDLATLDQSVEYAQAAYDKAHGTFAVAAARLADLQAQLATLMTQLDSNQKALTKAQSDLNGQQDALCDRMASIYKSGGTLGYLSALVGGDHLSIGDVMERFTLLSTIAQEDDDLLAQIKDLKHQIVQQRSTLEDQHRQVAALEADQAEVTGQLRAADQDCEASLSDVQAARAEKQALLSTIEKNKAAWEKQEDQILSDSDRVTALLKKTTSAPPPKAGKGVLSRPVPGPVVSGFGYRIHPIFHVRKLHTGVDLDAAMGDPIKAAAAGTVVFAGWRGGYGKCTIIDHGGGLATLYGHQSVILVTVGQVVKRGQVIGKVGSTGYSTGPHLHFEVRVNGTPVDPLGYL